MIAPWYSMTSFWNILKLKVLDHFFPVSFLDIQFSLYFELPIIDWRERSSAHFTHLWTEATFKQTATSTRQNFKTLSFKTTRISALSPQVSSLRQKQRGWATEKPSIFYEASIINMLMFHLYRDLPRIRLPVCRTHDPRRNQQSAELGSVGTMSLTRFHGFILGEW